MKVLGEVAQDVDVLLGVFVLPVAEGDIVLRGRDFILSSSASAKVAMLAFATEVSCGKG